MAGLLSTAKNTNSLAILSKIRQIKEDTERTRDQTHLIFTQAVNFPGETRFSSRHIGSTVPSQLANLGNQLNSFYSLIFRDNVFEQFFQKTHVALKLIIIDHKKCNCLVVRLLTGLTMHSCTVCAKIVTRGHQPASHLRSSAGAFNLSWSHPRV